MKSGPEINCTAFTPAADQQQLLSFFFGHSSKSSSLGRTHFHYLDGLLAARFKVLELPSRMFEGTTAPLSLKQPIDPQTSITAIFHSSLQLDILPRA
jgi:hypothetical protein